MVSVLHAEYMGAVTETTGDVFLKLESAPERGGYTYIILLDMFMQISDPENMFIPEGSYVFSGSYDAFNLDPEYTHANRSDSVAWIRFTEGTATVRREERKYVIERHFITKEGEPFDFHYNGSIPLIDDTPSHLTLIDHDQYNDFAAVEKAAYLGDYYGTGTSVFQTQFKEGDTQFLAEFFSESVAFSPDALPAGTFIISSDKRADILLEGSEINFGGWQYQPLGTYYNVNNTFGLATKGQVVVSKDASGYVMELDLVSSNGYKLQASYAGPIPFKDYTQGI